MTLVNGVRYDNELTYKYGNHKFALLPNSDGISIVKCSICLESRMYLSLMNMTECKEIKSLD
jgi:hypothetical protein